MIRRAKPSEIDEILTITGACAEKMNSEGIFQWNEEYPNREAFEKDVSRGELFVVEKALKIVGCIAISSKKDPEYENVNWLTPSGPNYYVHRLAIHPEFQRAGLARKAMDFAEHLARERSAISMRLDTFSQNKRNQLFYEARGYKRLEEIFFPKQSEFPFYCYELLFPVRQQDHRIKEK